MKKTQDKNITLAFWSEICNNDYKQTSGSSAVMGKEADTGKVNKCSKGATSLSQRGATRQNPLFNL